MINGIQNSYTIGNRSEIKPKLNDDTFTGAFDAAKKLLEATNEAEALTTQLTYDFATGKNENVHGLMVAQEKASILLQFTMQVRNNVLEAYREIMRIPV